jgi:hypothetical protein
MRSPPRTQQRGSLLVRSGKGGRRREVGIDAWGWEQLRPWLAARVELPIGPLFCVIDGPTRGRPWSSAKFRRLAAQASVRRRFAAGCARPWGAAPVTAARWAVAQLSPVGAACSAVGSGCAAGIASAPAAVSGLIVWASWPPPTCIRRGLAASATGIVSVSTPCSWVFAALPVRPRGG